MHISAPLSICLPTLNGQQSSVAKNGTEARDNGQSQLPEQETPSCVESLKASVGLLPVSLFPPRRQCFSKDFHLYLQARSQSFRW